MPAETANIQHNHRLPAGRRREASMQAPRRVAPADGRAVGEQRPADHRNSMGRGPLPEVPSEPGTPSGSEAIAAVIDAATRAPLSGTR